jgi:hypothetical protein
MGAETMLAGLVVGSTGVHRSEHSSQEVVEVSAFTHASAPVLQPQASRHSQGSVMA